jgi:nucleoside-diphosphate-sugar epimerase
MTNILITGHKGFIGTVLTSRLNKKFDVLGLDIKEGDDILTCELPHPSVVDVVIHLAGIGGVRESLADPKKYWDTNVEGTKRILNYYPNARILVAGSSSQYEPELNPYAASKHIIEYIPHNNVCFMRFHTVYGPSPRANMFFDKLLNNKLEYVTAHKRDFIHIEDLCDGIELLIDSQVQGPIDIGTGTTVSVQEIRPDLPVKLNTIGERQVTQANTRAMRTLGHRPKYTVENFLKERGFK